MATAVRENVQMWRGRAEAGLKVFKLQTPVDNTKIAAIGYCFGGSTCLQLAYAGNDLKAVAGQIGANEAQHLTTFKRLSAGNTLVPNPSFPDSLTAKQATAAVTPFLA